MKKKYLFILTIVFLIICTGPILSKNDSKKNMLNRWNSFNTNPSIRVLTMEKSNSGNYRIQMVNVLNALGKAKISELTQILLKIGDNKRPVSLGKYLPRGYIAPKGNRTHIFGVEPTTFPSTEPSVWKQIINPIFNFSRSQKQLKGILMFRNGKGKLMAIISTKIIVK